MGMGETAELVADLSLKGNFNKGMKTAAASTTKLERNIDRITKRTGAFSGFINRNLSRAVDTLALQGVQAIGQGLEELATLEDATTSVTGAIAQVGKGWKLTADDIATAANEIESATDAAFDDKAIVAATETLIRYGKVSEDNIRPAMEVMTDLAARTGDVDSASTLLAKALADPTKAAGKLARQGIILTKGQEKQIKAMVKAGKTAEAQALLLDILADTTKGAAAASAGPYRDALNKLGDAGEDLRRGFVTGLAPAILEVSDLLTTELAKPSTIAALKDAGKAVGGALKGIIATAKTIPWGTIGESLKIAGTGAKAVLDAFLGMPSWVQAAVISGWGLNKLTGGALTGIIGELGKGLIKGVLGINAGVVNIKAGAVTGGGGVVPAGGGKGGAVSTGGRLLDAASKLLLVGFVAEMADLIHEQIKPPSTATSDLSWPWGPKNTPTLLPEIFGGNGLLGGDPGSPIPVVVKGGDRPSPGNPGLVKGQLKEAITPAVAGVTAAVKNAQSVASRENSSQKAEIARTTRAISTMSAEQRAQAVAAIAAQNAASVLAAVRDMVTQATVRTGAANTTAATRGVAPPISAAVYSIGRSISATIWAARPVIQSTNVVNNYTTRQRTGASTGSRNSGPLEY